MALPAVAPVVNDPALQFDAMAHCYSLHGRPLISVTTALRLAGMVNTRGYNEYARARGEYLHAAIALYAQGTLDESSIDPALAPYFEAFLSFIADTGVEFEMVERRVCDPVVGYAGTLDAIVRWPSGFTAINTRRVLIDWKSGHFPPMAAPQTAAYLRCARHLYPAGTRIGRAGLQLRNDGTYRLHEFNNIVEDELDFLSAVRVCAFRDKHGIE